MRNSSVPSDRVRNTIRAGTDDIVPPGLIETQPPGSPAKEDGNMAIDPVCGMQVDEKTTLYRSEHDGRTVFFCSPGCKREFDGDPQKFMGRDEPPPHQHHA